MSISLYKFYSDIRIRAAQHNERFGQAAFNHLALVRPDLSEKVRGTDMDPYYSENGGRWNKFVQFIETNWYPASGD